MIRPDGLFLSTTTNAIPICAARPLWRSRRHYQLPERQAGKVFPVFIKQSSSCSGNFPIIQTSRKTPLHAGCHHRDRASRRQTGRARTPRWASETMPTSVFNSIRKARPRWSEEQIRQPGHDAPTDSDPRHLPGVVGVIYAPPDDAVTRNLAGGRDFETQDIGDLLLGRVLGHHGGPRSVDGGAFVHDNDHSMRKPSEVPRQKPIAAPLAMRHSMLTPPSPRAR